MGLVLEVEPTDSSLGRVSEDEMQKGRSRLKAEVAQECSKSDPRRSGGAEKRAGWDCLKQEDLARIPLLMPRPGGPRCLLREAPASSSGAEPFSAFFSMSDASN